MLIDRVKQKFSNQFIRNVGWLGIAEIITRIFRLGATVILARMFTKEDYGLMAIVFTSFEFATILPFKGGVAAKIIQADQQDVKVLCDTSYWLNWIMCGLIFMIQCSISLIYSQYYGNDKIFLPLCVVSLNYLILPLFMVHAALLERENKLKVIAICNAAQGVVSNLIIIVFALLGMGVWSIVWAMLLSTPIWVVVNWKYEPWRPPLHFTLERWQEIVHFGKNILGVELLNKLRMNIDYLIVGQFLGIEALGMYYFAFNAGSGITNNVVNAVMSALFPYLCGAREDYRQFQKRYFGSLKTIASTIVPIVILQSSLAYFYVPIIFGQKWIPAIPILIMICLSVIPRTFGLASSMLLNAIDKTNISLRIDLVFTIVFTLSLLLAVNWGIYWVAAAVLICHWSIVPATAIWSSRYALKK